MWRMSGVVIAGLLFSACVEPHATGNAGVVAGGLDAGPWENLTENLAGMSSECGNVAYLTSRPNDGAVIAGVARDGLWTRPTAATDWSQIGQGAGSTPIVNRPQQFVYDPLDANTWWESGIYNSFGIYKTIDNGATFAALGLGTGANTVNCCDSLSVDLSDPARQTMLAGAHEALQHLFRSGDGGKIWTDIGSTLPSDSGHSAYTLILDQKLFLLGTWNASGSGIFRSTDGGDTWTKVLNIPMRSIPLVTADGTIYWQADGNLGAVRSVDLGLTWTIIAGANTLLTNTAGLVELPNGRIAGLGFDTGAGNGHVLVSSDRGDTWKAINTVLPIAPTGLLYSNAQQSIYAWHWTCVSQTDSVAADAIQRLVFP
jgi:hypothetical protein